jgi:signal transduction histidine kinase/PAS domain-containing protein
VARPEASALLSTLEPGAPVGVAVHDDELRELLRSPSLAGVGIDGGARQALASGRALTGIELTGAGRAWVGSWYLLERAGRRLVATVAVDVTEHDAAEARLRASRARLDRAQQLAGLGSYAWDARRNVWIWSEELFRLAGLDPAGGPPDWEAWLPTVAPESRQALREAVRSAIRDGRPFDLHFRQRRPDTSQRILRSRGGPVFGPGGVLTGIEGFAQDVTELKRAEDHQRAVAALGQAALGGLPLEELMERATEIVAATLELDHVSVFEVVPGGERLLLRAGLGWPLEQIGRRQAEIGHASHAGYTMLVGEPVVVQDWTHEERFRQPDVLAAAGVRSGGCVIIGDPAAPYGTLAAHSVHPGAVGPEHVMFLQAVANVLDSAVARLRAEELIAEQAAARGRLVAQALDAEDRTRREISELLHDGPLQDLLALNQELLRLEASGEHLDRARAGIARAIGALREIMVDLHPVAFEVAGLESALGAVADQQARQGSFACELSIDPAAGGVRDDLVIALARELLTNAAKHADASHVRVTVRRTADAILLEVADDGSGIPEGRLAAALREGHIGLASSIQRVEAVGGTFTLSPVPGGGTAVAVTLPTAAG